ncbi:MAG: tRNA (guanosine(37)-N1)-methyltransferase TrmD, partial [Acetanaerobacterium sp.]
DAVARMCEGVLASDECFELESHYAGLLEHPQYTRPPEWEGVAVPEVLLSGHHANIEQWRRRQMLKTTYERRRDMLQGAQLDKHDLAFLQQLSQEEDT